MFLLLSSTIVFNFVDEIPNTISSLPQPKPTEYQIKIQEENRGVKQLH